MKTGQVFDESNTIRAGDIGFFVNRRAPQSLDALLVCNIANPQLLKRVTGLIKTGGILALRGVRAKAIREVFLPHWQFSFCRDGDVIFTRVCRREGSSEVLWDELPFAHYMDLLRRGVPFSYLRYGDGEFNGALETLYPGYTYQRFTPELREDLQVSLIDYYADPHYIMSLAPIYHFRDKGQRSWELIAAFLRENDLTDIVWASTQTFNDASQAGQLWPFIQHLQQSNVVIVGDPRLRALNKIFPRAAFIPVSNKHCHGQSQEIQKAILAQDLPAIILFTAGPATVTLIHKLYPHIGDSSTMMDIGTTWGPYVGQVWRGGHRGMIPGVINKNIRKA